MAAGEKRHQEVLHRLLLAHDHLADLAGERRDLGDQGLDFGFGLDHEASAQAVMAWTTMLTPNFVLSSASQRLLR